MIRFFLLAALLPACSFAKRPNVLLIMADDVGIEGFGCYGGSSYRTPQVDKLAEEGLRFTHAYSQPLCTPTRVQIMTGRYNHRNWTYFGILDPKEKTFGHLMKEAGYKTCISGNGNCTPMTRRTSPMPIAGAAGNESIASGFRRALSFSFLAHREKGSATQAPLITRTESS